MSSRTRASLRPSVLLTTLLILLPPPPTLRAQRPELRLHVFAGVLDARGGLPNAPTLSAPGTVVSYARLSATAVLGAGLELGAGVLPASLRVTASGSLGGDEVGRWGCADESGDPLPCPSILIEVPTDLTTSTVTLDLIGALPLGVVTLRPLLGVAWIRHSYDWDPAPVGSFSLEPGSNTDDDAALHYGLGAAVSLGRARLELELSELRSEAGRVRPRRTVGTALGISVPVR